MKDYDNPYIKTSVFTKLRDKDLTLIKIRVYVWLYMVIALVVLTMSIGFIKMYSKCTYHSSETLARDMRDVAYFSSAISGLAFLYGVYIWWHEDTIWFERGYKNVDVGHDREDADPFVLTREGNAIRKHSQKTEDSIADLAAQTRYQTEFYDDE